MPAATTGRPTASMRASSFTSLSCQAFRAVSRPWMGEYRKASRGFREASFSAMGARGRGFPQPSVIWPMVALMAQALAWPAWKGMPLGKKERWPRGDRAPARTGFRV